MRIYVSLILFVMFHYSFADPKELCNGRRPSFSPDGKFIAYEYYGKIYTLHLKTNKRKVISNLSESSKPRWSPDGRKIIFQARGPTEKMTSFAIWVVDKDGTHLTQLIKPSNENNHTPCFSKDGKKIAWTRGKEIWIANSDGQNSHLLMDANDNVHKWVCDWSPNNKTIAFVRAGAEFASSWDARMWLIDSNGQNLKRIYEEVLVLSARWFKDSSFIAILNCCYVINYNIDNSDDQYYYAYPQMDAFDLSTDNKYIVFEISDIDIEDTIYLDKIEDEEE